MSPGRLRPEVANHQSPFERESRRHDLAVNCSNGASRKASLVLLFKSLQQRLLTLRSVDRQTRLFLDDADLINKVRPLIQQVEYLDIDFVNPFSNLFQ